MSKNLKDNSNGAPDSQAPATTMTRRGALGTCISIIISGVVELFTNIPPWAYGVCALVVFAYAVWGRQDWLDGRIEHACDVIKQDPVTFIFFVFTATSALFLILQSVPNASNSRIADINHLTSSAGRTLTGDARRAFIHGLQTGERAEGKVLLVAQEFCNECNDFLATIRSALEQAELTAEPWPVRSNEKGAPSGVTVRGPKSCDDGKSIQVKLTVAFNAAGIAAVCQVEGVSDADAYVYVSAEY